MMLTVFLVTLSVFALAVTAMAVGVIVSNRRIRGSCGGLSVFRDDLGRPVCDACAECPEKKPECELETTAAGGVSGSADRSV